MTYCMNSDVAPEGLTQHSQHASSLPLTIVFKTTREREREREREKERVRDRERERESDG